MKSRTNTCAVSAAYQSEGYAESKGRPLGAVREPPALLSPDSRTSFYPDATSPAGVTAACKPPGADL